jgi:methionyl-tRNA synthetase
VGVAVADAPPLIDYEDFAKIQLRVGLVVAAERHPHADKLLKLTVDVGEPTPRTILAGIAKVYTPEQLLNILTIRNLFVI